MEKIKESGSVTDKTLARSIAKDGYNMSDDLFNKTLLSMEIMGLINVNWLTKDTRRIEIIVSKEKEDEDKEGKEDDEDEEETEAEENKGTTSGISTSTFETTLAFSTTTCSKGLTSKLLCKISTNSSDTEKIGSGNYFWAFPSKAMIVVSKVEHAIG